MSSPRHAWRFFRAGGFDQVQIDTGADIAHLDQLDLKLWAALSCPVKGLEFDERTLALIDSDKDARVRASEVLEALDFLKINLRSLDGLTAGKERLPLAAINDGVATGRAMLACAKRILAGAGKPDAADIGLAEIDAMVGKLANTDFNGDGIIPPASAREDDLRQALADILASVGGAVDRNGEKGVDQASLDAFVKELSAFDGWWRLRDTDPAILPLGDATPGAFAAVAALRTKVDDYFARCRVAAFDPRALAAVNRQEKDYLALAATDLSVTAEEIARFPLATIEAHRPLPLVGDLNPAWLAAMAAFRSQVVEPLLGERSQLSESEWTGICARFAPYGAWLAAKSGARVEGLGIARVRTLLAGDLPRRVADLIAHDKSLAPEFEAIVPVEKLVRLYRDYHRLLRNFINFADFYSPTALATFQAGTLLLDSRACELCVRVDDQGKHALLAGMSKVYLAYCECVRPGCEKMTVAAAFTAGDSDYLFVGRNGVFYDRKGRDWDATIVKVIENPISIRQAFWSPYKKAIRFVEELVAKRAAAADDQANARLTSGVEATAKAAEAGKQAAPKPKIDLSIIAALGVAVGGISGAITGFFMAIFGLGLYMPLGFLGIILAISGPSMVIAALKLRQRNLGPILDANGWAVNGRVRITIPFGGALTAQAQLPPGSTRSLFDPYAEKKRPWKLWLALGIAAAAALWVLYDRVHSKHWFWQDAPPTVTTTATATVTTQSEAAPPAATATAGTTPKP